MKLSAMGRVSPIMAWLPSGGGTWTVAAASAAKNGGRLSATTVRVWAPEGTPVTTAWPVVACERADRPPIVTCTSGTRIVSSGSARPLPFSSVY